MIDLTLDFETYFNSKDKYSLKTMRTATYVRDAKFQVTGCAVKLGAKETEFLSSSSEVASYLDAKIRSHEVNLICHNTYFDGLILSEHFDFVPKRYSDTMAMARGLVAMGTSVGLDNLAQQILDKKKEVDILDFDGVIEFTEEDMARIKRRAVDDVDLTWELYNKLLETFPEGELESIHNTVSMAAAPVIRIDAPLLHTTIDTVETETDALLAELGLDRTQVSSSPQFVEVLKDAGVTVPMKKNPKGDMIPAFAKTDLAFRDLETSPDKRTRDLVKARLSVKSNQKVTRAKAFLEVTHDGELPMPVPLKFGGAHTIRWSGEDRLNMQNLGRKSELRECLMAPPGHMFVIYDLSQIEARIVAWLFGQKDLQAAFDDVNRDPYCEFGTVLFGFEVNAKDHFIERWISKTCLLGLQYGVAEKTLLAQLKGFGISIPGLEKLLDITVKDCYQYTTTYRGLYDRITNGVDRYRDPRNPETGWVGMETLLGDMIDGVETGFGPNDVLQTTKGNFGCEYAIARPGGMKLQYPQIESIRCGFTGSHRDITYMGRNYRTNLYGGKVTENVGQALAGDIMREQINEVTKESDGLYKLVLQVHDEMVACVPEAKAGEADKLICEIMHKTPAWAPGLTLAAEGGISDRYNK